MRCRKIKGQGGAAGEIAVATALQPLLRSLQVMLCGGVGGHADESSIPGLQLLSPRRQGLPSLRALPALEDGEATRPPAPGGQVAKRKSAPEPDTTAKAIKALVAGPGVDAAEPDDAEDDEDAEAGGSAPEEAATPKLGKGGGKGKGGPKKAGKGKGTGKGKAAKAKAKPKAAPPKPAGAAKGGVPYTVTWERHGAVAKRCYFCNAHYASGKAAALTRGKSADAAKVFAQKCYKDAGALWDKSK